MAKVIDVYFYDRTQKNVKHEKGLTHWWSLGRFMGFDHWKACNDAEEVYKFIHDLPMDVQIRGQFWGHGRSNWRMYVGDDVLDQDELIKAGRGRWYSLWGRACDTLCGEGRKMAERWVSQTNADYIGHNVVTNWPAFTHQSGLYAYGPMHLKAGKPFSIPNTDGDGWSHVGAKRKRTVLTTRMTAPGWAWVW